MRCAVFRLLFLVSAILSFSSVLYAFTLVSAQKTSVITGYTRAVSTMTVTAETSGRLSQVNYGMGDTADGVFAVIDPVFTKLEIKAAEAAIRKLEVSAARIQSNIDFHKKDHARVETLYLSDAESESRRDASKLALDQAELSLAELQQEKAAIEVNLERLKEQLKRQYIKIPAGWTVTSKPLEAGELVSAGQPIASAGDFRKLVVPVFAENAQVRYLQSLGTFDVKVDGRITKAKLSRVSPAFDERTRKREIEIMIEESGIGGLFTEIQVRAPSEGFMVNSGAVSERYANPVIKPKGSDKNIRIRILGREGDMVFISSDEELKAGMELEAVR
jgi:multidrug efflux pump subunit AcrA (membrane-fusion protein)